MAQLKVSRAPKVDLGQLQQALGQNIANPQDVRIVQGKPQALDPLQVTTVAPRNILVGQTVVKPSGGIAGAKLPEGGIDVRKVLVGLAQSIPRAVPNIGISIADPFMKGKQVYKPTGFISKIIGTEPITSYQERRRGLQKDWGKNKYIKGIATPLSYIGTGLNIGGDVAIVGGTAKKAIKAGVTAKTTGLRTAAQDFKPGKYPTEYPGQKPPTVTPTAEKSVKDYPGANLVEKSAAKAKAEAEKYGGTGIKAQAQQKLQAAKDIIEPRNVLIAADRARAKAMGISAARLPSSMRLEKLAQDSESSIQKAKQAFAQSNIAQIVKKYGKTGEQDFNFYRIAIRDLEQRAAGGREKVMPNVNNRQLRNEINRIEKKYPGIRNDVQVVAQDVKNLQDWAIKQEGLTSPEDLMSARLKPNGTGEFQYYSPIERQLPEDLAKQVVSGKNIGSLGRQRILREMTGSMYEPKYDFKTLENYYATVFQDVYKAKLGRAIGESAAQGFLPGARFVQTGEQTAKLKSLKTTLSELTDIQKSLKNEIRTQVSKARVARQKLATEVAKGKISNVRAEKNLSALEKAAKEKLTIAANRAKELIVKSIDPQDVDALAAANSLKQKDLLDILSYITKEELFYKPPAGKKTLKVAKTAEQKAKAAQELTKSQVASMNRIANRSEAFNRIIDDIQNMRMDYAQLQQSRKGIKSTIYELRPEPTTGMQVLHGIDEAGNKFKIELPPSAAKYIQGLGEEKLNAVLSVIKKFQEPFKVALTGPLNVPFQLSQGIWNAVMLPINSKQGIKVFGPKAIKGGFQALNKNSDFMQGIIENGGKTYNSIYSLVKNDSVSDALMGQYDELSKFKWYSNPKRLWNKFNEVGGKLDNFARGQSAEAAYLSAIKRGASTEDAIADGIFAWNNTLSDWSNQSNLIRQIDAVIPYFAPSVAGTRTTLRALRDMPVKNAAVLGTYVGLGVTNVANNLAQENGKAFYDDMQSSGKGYILDNNVIVVLPGAKKDENTGKWFGIVKIPLTPELRPINKSIRESFMNNGPGIPVGAYARSFLDFVTGTVRQSSSPAAQIITAIRTGKDPYFGNAIYDQTMSSSEKANAIKNYVIKSFGGPGKVAASDKKFQTWINQFVDRVYGAKGSTSGSRYFKDEEKAIKDIGLNANELNAYLGTVAPKTKDLNGNVIKDKTYWDSSSKAQTWLRYPKTYEVAKKIDEARRKRGEPGDPLFDLPPEKVRTILNLMANPSPGNAEDRAITKLNPWLQDFYTQRSQYFDIVMSQEQKNKSKVDPMGIDIPQSSNQLQGLINQANKLTGADKYAFYSDHPEITDYFKQLDDYQRQKRKFMGLPQFDPYPEPSPEVKQLFDYYNSLPKGEANGKSKIRSAWIKSNPDAWAKMTEQWRQQDLYNIAKEGSLAIYEGIDFTDKTLKKMGMLPGQKGQTTVGLSQRRLSFKPRKIRIRKVKSPTIKKVDLTKIKIVKTKKPKRIKIA